MFFWIKTDIDGTGEKYRLAHKRGKDMYFVAEDFEDLAANYIDCKSVAIDPPGKDRQIGAWKETIKRIVDGELWAGHIECRSCGHMWVGAAPWSAKEFECPKCKIISAHKHQAKGEEMVDRIMTALVKVAGLNANAALGYLEGELNMELGAALPSGVRDSALVAIHDMRPICEACNGHGGDCDAGDDGRSVSWVCEKCGGTGRDYDTAGIV